MFTVKMEDGLSETVLHRLRITPLGFSLWVIVNEKHINLEKTTYSVLSVILINLWIKLKLYIL